MSNLEKYAAIARSLKESYPEITAIKVGQLNQARLAGEPADDIVAMFVYDTLDEVLGPREPQEDAR